MRWGWMDGGRAARRLDFESRKKNFLLNANGFAYITTAGASSDYCGEEDPTTMVAEEGLYNVLLLVAQNPFNGGQTYEQHSYTPTPPGRPPAQYVLRRTFGESKRTIRGTGRSSMGTNYKFSE